MSGDRPARETEAENCGIEITPEMVKAGILCLFEYGIKFNNEAAVVEDIFLTMLSLAQK